MGGISADIASGIIPYAGKNRLDGRQDAGRRIRLQCRRRAWPLCGLAVAIDNFEPVPAQQQLRRWWGLGAA